MSSLVFLSFLTILMLRKVPRGVSETWTRGNRNTRPWSWWELAGVSWRPVAEEDLHCRARRRHYGSGDHQQDQLQFPIQDSLYMQWIGCLYDLITSNLTCVDKKCEILHYIKAGCYFSHLSRELMKYFMSVRFPLCWFSEWPHGRLTVCPVLCRQPFALSNFFMWLD